MRTRHRAGLCTMAVTALVLSACADDDDDAADDTTAPTAAPTTVGATTTMAEPTTTQATATTEGTTVTTEATGGAVSEEFCSTVVEAEAIASAGPDVDFEAATEEEVAAAMEEFSAALLPLLDQLGGNVPDEIAGDLETIDSALRSGIETGDDPASQPGFVEADRAVDQYVADNCGFEVYTVRAVDYAFEDVPATIEAGIVGFDLQNEGREVHEMVLFRIADDVDLSLEELVDLPEDESESMVEFVTAAFAAPGESDLTFHELRPGRYGMLCFIPLGTTDMSMLEGGPGGEATGEATGDTGDTADAPPTSEATGEATATSPDQSQMGPPHFTEGMMTEFEVVEAGTGADSGSTSPSTTNGSDSSSPSTTDDSGSPTTTDSDSSAPTTTGG